MKVSTLSDLVHISLNTRDEGIFENFASTDAQYCEHLEEFGQSSIVDDSLDADQREEDEPTDSEEE